METCTSIDSSLFSALKSINLDQLTGKDVSCVLPYLTKLLLNPYFTKRKQVLQLIYPIRKTNDILQLLRAEPIDAHENINLPVSCFEQSQPNHRLRIVANEYFRIQDQIRKSNGQGTKFIKSDLFDNPLYLDDVSFCLSLLNEPTTINILDMSETLLHVKYGAVYIVRLIANLPDLCQEVCHSLVTHGETQDEGTNFNEVTEQRAKTLRKLCQMNPSMAMTIRSITVQLQRVPSLTIMITLDQLDKSMEKFVAESDELMADDEDSSSDLMSDQMSALEDTFDNSIAFITGILLGADEETRNWFATYTKSAQQKRIDHNHFTVLSQFRPKLVEYIQKLYSFILEDTSQTRITDPKLYTTIDCPSKKLIRATAILRLFCALRGVGMLKLNHEESEIILQLITSRLTASQTSVNFVTTGVCTILVCSSLVTNPRDEKRASEWLKWIISEQSGYTNYKPNLGTKSISDLLHLIGINYQQNQTSEIAELVCSTLGMKLQIKATVSRCRSLFQEVISEPMLTDHVVESNQLKDSEPLSTEDETLNNIEQVDTEKTMPILCMHQLLESVETKSIELLGSSTASFLGVTINGSSHIKPSKAMKEDLERRFSEDFQTINDDPIKLLRTINNILILPNDEVGNLMDIFIENWSKFLSLNSSPENRKLIQLAAKLWRKFNTILPRKLWTMTVNSLRRTQTLKSELPYTWNELTNDPLIVLRCDSRVFRCPDILNILLLILDAFLASSRRSLQTRHNAESLKDLKATLIFAQTSAAVQILLEFCLPNEEEQRALNKRDSSSCDKEQLSEKELALLERFDASVNCICEHIHQVFISDTNLAKLVHFQTYPSELLATTCDRIPSMHICLDYIPELISQPDQGKQVFVIQLASHLCEKYAITKSLNAAKLCFNVAYTLLQLLPSDKRALFYIPVLPALLRTCKVFPILQEDTKIILNQINQITLAHMASTTSRLSLNSTKPFEGLEKLAWSDVEKLMQTLNLNEALYLCIQKCLSDVDNWTTVTTTTSNNKATR